MRNQYQIQTKARAQIATEVAKAQKTMDETKDGEVYHMSTELDFVLRQIEQQETAFDASPHTRAAGQSSLNAKKAKAFDLMMALRATEAKD